MIPLIKFLVAFFSAYMTIDCDCIFSIFMLGPKIKGNKLALLSALVGQVNKVLNNL